MHAHKLQLSGLNWHVQQQDPITLSDGESEPDLAIIRGDTEDYTENHPGPSDIAIVIEVLDATINRDQGTKKRTYAQNGIGEYWIVNLIENCIESIQNQSVQRNAPTISPKSLVVRKIDSL